MHPVGFEPTLSAGERPKTYALDRAATGTGNEKVYWQLIWRIPHTEKFTTRADSRQGTESECTLVGISVDLSKKGS